MKTRTEPSNHLFVLKNKLLYLRRRLTISIFLCAVRLLQASDQLRLQLRQQHAVERHPHRNGPGLQGVVQRRGALLRLPVVQGRRGGHAEAQLEALRHHQHRLPRLHHHRLLRRLLRLQEQPQGPPQRRRVQAAGRVRLIAWLGYLLLGWMRSSCHLIVVFLLGWPDLALYRRDYSVL